MTGKQESEKERLIISSLLPYRGEAEADTSG
jgi:hypothetical protein